MASHETKSTTNMHCSCLYSSLVAR